MIALNNNDLRNCTPGKRENMLGFKRILADSWQAVFRIACNLLMQVSCNSDFLAMGEEMHYLLLFCVNRVFPLSPVPALFLLFVLTGGHMAGNRPVGPRSKGARFYSVKLRKHFFCFICLTLLACVVYRVCMFAIKRI